MNLFIDGTHSGSPSPTPSHLDFWMLLSKCTYYSGMLRWQLYCGGCFLRMPCRKCLQRLPKQRCCELKNHKPAHFLLLLLLPCFAFAAACNSRAFWFRCAIAFPPGNSKIASKSSSEDILPILARAMASRFTIVLLLILKLAGSTTAAYCFQSRSGSHKTGSHCSPCAKGKTRGTV